MDTENQEMQKLEKNAYYFGNTSPFFKVQLQHAMSAPQIISTFHLLLLLKLIEPFIFC